MSKKTRITLTGINIKSLDNICNELKEIAQKTGVKYSGPVYLPTKRAVIPTRRSPCGQGSKTWDKLEMRIFRRLFEIEPNERAMKYIIRLPIPDDVFIEVRVQ
jgi:ribosomal protein uS10